MLQREMSEWITGADKIADAHDRVLGNLASLGLERAALELEVSGYTVLSREQLGAHDLEREVRDEILAIHERKTGVTPDLATGQSHSDLQAPLGRGTSVREMVFEGLAFERMLTMLPLVALLTFLLGENYILNTSDSMIKGPGGAPLSLHTDWFGFPEPAPRWPISATSLWMLSDASQENGATVVVPGSHLLGRGPTPGENAAIMDLAKPIEAPAGSLAIWNSGLWHGAAPRTAPGLRITMHNLYTRWPLAPQQPTSSKVTSEMVDRNPDRFATIMGLRRPTAPDIPDWARRRFKPHGIFDRDRFSPAE